MTQGEVADQPLTLKGVVGYLCDNGCDGPNIITIIEVVDHPLKR
jgi:hypothetical protein